MKYRVLIVEDHHLLRRGLSAMVGALPDFEVLAEAKDGKEAVRQAVSLQPDLILMDLSLPRMTGIEATTQIKARLPHIHIVALTAFKNDEYVHAALRAGVDGYVMKDASYEELLSALRNVMAGKKFLSPDVSGQLVDTLLHRGSAPRPPSAWEKLTSRERGILKLIAEGRTNRSAAEFLNVSPKTVEKHRGNLMRKLGLGNVCELTVVALETGLIERPRTVSRLLGEGRTGGHAQASDAARDDGAHEPNAISERSSNLPSNGPALPTS
jgi:DNA-binding NarL/FixJ family response regulator